MYGSAIAVTDGKQCVSVTTTLPICGIDELIVDNKCVPCGSGSTNPAGNRSYYCTCKPGYTVDGQVGGATTISGSHGEGCRQVTVCPTDQIWHGGGVLGCIPCGANSTNTDGNTYCTCKPGYTVDGSAGGATAIGVNRSCVKIGEADTTACKINQYWDGDSCSNCGKNSVSVNQNDDNKYPYCICKNGYTANGKYNGATAVAGGANCIEIPACGIDQYWNGGLCLSCGANSTNPNNNKSSYCTCKDGYIAETYKQGDFGDGKTVAGNIDCVKIKNP